jgi:hypothetical protein
MTDGDSVRLPNAHSGPFKCSIEWGPIKSPIQLALFEWDRANQTGPKVFIY